jgi:oligoendopeptidase F
VTRADAALDHNVRSVEIDELGVQGAVAPRRLGRTGAIRAGVPPWFLCSITCRAVASTAEHLADPELLAAEWNLSPLIEGEDPANLELMLAEVVDLASRFAADYAGKIATLEPAELVEAMHALERVNDLIGRVGSYAALRFAADTADPARGALLQRVQERATEIETKLLFFELEWAALDDERAEALLAAPELDFCRHYLRSARRYRPHLLSEPEEKILAEKSISSHAAWSRLFGELVAALRVELEGQEVPLDVALSRLQSPDREARRTAAEAVSEALEPGLRIRAFIYNTLVYDKSVEDRLRSYPHWLASRNLANEASDESVMALIEAVRRRFDIPHRWYALKAKLLGLDRIADYDRVAPVQVEEVSFSYRDARELVLDTYSSFSPESGEVVRRFFEERWIDAPVRPNKRGGAFCSYTVPSVHPYVLLNFTARRRDVLTMAHELGHGLHAALAARQGLFHQATPLTLAETASVFGETLVFERLLDAAGSPQERLGLLAEQIDGSISTVFRQIGMNRFEHLVHSRRREEGELSVPRIAELWIETQVELLGDAVEVTEGYRSWWSYVPHFINTAGYVYAYAYGQLLALSAYGRYREEGKPFVPRYLDLLRAGGSRSPEQLGAIIGIDLADPGFWDSGLALVDRMLGQAEELAASA